eukprot:1171749-Alexandrium_andersonii.AAC.1
MSASLVGSEMCIRDSPPSRPGGCKQNEGGDDGRGGDGGGGQDEDTRRGPVSYTHLTLPTICSV